MARTGRSAFFRARTFFRAIARGQNYGVIARALALKWPKRGARNSPSSRRSGSSGRALRHRIVVYGLIDSDSASAVMRATIRPAM